MYAIKQQYRDSGWEAVKRGRAAGTARPFTTDLTVGRFAPEEDVPHVANMACVTMVFPGTVPVPASETLRWASGTEPDAMSAQPDTTVQIVP